MKLPTTLLSPAIHELGKGRTDLEEMTPGEHTWIWPFAIDNVNGTIVIDEGKVEKGKNRTQVASVKVFKDHQGIVLDVTALSPEEVRNTFIDGPASDILYPDGYAEVSLVLFPRFGEEAGLSPEALREYNEAQTEVIEQFKEYHLDTYGTPYTLAILQEA